jgi:hypothetical protein
MRRCVGIREVMGMGFSHTQAYYTLMHLVRSGRAVQVKLNRYFTIWCFSGHSAVKHMNKLRGALHSLICTAKMKYVSPVDALDLIVNDRQARKLFSRYIELKPDSRSLHFLNGLLILSYGRPVRVMSNRKPVYFVDCRRPLPPPTFGGVQGVRV